MLKSAAVCFILTVLAGCQIAPIKMAPPTSTYVNIHNLAKEKQTLIGNRVWTHGCLVNSPHGSFIEPCGSNDWREITVIDDPSYLVGAAFGDLDIDFSYNVEADFLGDVIEQDVTFPEPLGKRVFLRLISVTNSKPYEP
jgi:hypothetical protein